jgi:hypothetical protein
MRITQIAFALALIAAPAASLAHEVAIGPNGGQVVDDKGHHVELTVKGQEIVLYLSDKDDKPIPSKGATGKAVIQDAGKTAAVDLVPAEPNLLSAKLGGNLGKGAKVVVSAKLSDGHSVQARFVVK